MQNSVYQVWIGVDVAARKLDLYDLQREHHQVIENDLLAISSFISQLSRLRKKCLVVMEATGGYENTLVDALLEAGIDCAVVNPLNVRHFAKGCGLLEKTDKIDARVIAKFAQVVSPKPKDPLSEDEKKLRALVHRRSQILAQMASEKNRKQQTVDSDTSALIDQAITFYRSQLKDVEQRIAQLVKAAEAFRNKSEVLSSCPGVGPATVGVLLAELPELGQLSRGQVAKLVGVAPLAKDSGEKSSRRKTSAGRSTIRKVLYMAALVSARYNAPMRAFYQRLVGKGKPKKVALVAVMRKLIICLNTMIKNNEMWRDPPLALDRP